MKIGLPKLFILLLRFKNHQAWWFFTFLFVGFLLRPALSLADRSVDPMIQTNEASPLAKLSFMPIWNHQFQFAGFYAAEMKGYYQQEGLDVDIKDWIPGSEALEEVASGRVDFSLQDSSLLIAAAKGADIRIIMSNFQYSPLVLLSHTPIHSLSDLSGKRMMYADRLQVRTLVKRAQSKIERPVIQVPVTGNLQDFIDQKVDLYEAYYTNELFRLDQLGIPYYLIDPQNFGIYSYADLLFTRSELVKTSPDLVMKFRRAIIKGWEYALSHPTEVVDYLLANYSVKKSREALLDEARKTARFVQPESYSIGKIELSKMRSISEDARATGLLAEADFKRLDLDTLIFNPKLSFTREERAYLAKNPVIRLADHYNRAPLEYIDHEGRYRGVVADYFKLITQKLGVSFKIEPEQSWEKVLKSVREGEAKVIACAAKTPERNQYLKFTDPYLKFPMVLIAPEKEHYIESYHALHEKTIAVVKGDWSEEFLRQYPHLKILPVNTVKEGLEAILYGRAYGFNGNLVLIQEVIKHYGLAGLKVIGQASENFELAIGVRKDEPVLFSILQKSLMDVSEAEHQVVINKWLQLKIDHSMSWRHVLQKYQVYFMLSGLMFLALIVFVYQQRKQHLLQIKLSEIEKETAMLHAEHFQKIAEQEAWYRQEQSQFFAMLTHEMKTPVAMIDGAIQSLKLINRDDQVQKQKRLTRIEKGVMRLNKLMQNFMQKRQLEAQDFTLTLKKTNLKTLLATITEDYPPETLNCYFPEDEVVLALDEKFITLAVENVIDNAVKYANSERPIELHLITKPNKIFVLIKDYGNIIDSQDRETLFMPYYRSNRVQNIEGSGLGLYLVQKIMHLHQGKVFYLPNLPVGNRFYLEWGRSWRN